jgi:uncharacterized damage-inducible protein DinB
MGEIERLADLHRRALEGESWHGPALLEVLQDVTAARAMARPIAGAHTIWEIVLHIRAWDDVVLRRLEGTHVRPAPHEDWPPVTDPSEAAWSRDLGSMTAMNRELNRALSRLSEGVLEERMVPDREDVLALMVYGAIEHELYHAGQIALLTRA